MRSMDSILSDQPTVNDLPESAESVKEEPSQEAQEPKQETVKTTEPQEDQPDEEDQHVPDDLSGLKRALAAARGDKRKARKQWQEAERAMAELRGRLSVVEQPKQEPQKTKIPDLTDEEFFSKGSEAVKEYIQHQLASVRDEQRTQRLNYSEAAARERHEDFQDSLNEFKRMAQTQPHLWQQMDQSHDPGEFVHKTGKALKELQGISDIDEFKKKIEAEVRAKIEAEKTQTQQLPPRSIAGARGTGNGSTQTWAGPRSMDEILR